MSIADPTTDPAQEELRSNPRHGYPYQQLIAPVVEGRIPLREEFVAVPCADLSVGGMAFLYPQAPTFQELLVALGPPQRETLLLARVAHTSPTDDEPPQHRVGCVFLGRIWP